jgi:hypothetical protein
MKKTLVKLIMLAFSCFLINSAFAAGGGGVVTADPSKHFDPKGKEPSKFTIEFQNGMRKSLPIEDKRDFEEAKKGFIAAPEYKQIMAEAGNVVDPKLGLAMQEVTNRRRIHGPNILHEIRPKSAFTILANQFKNLIKSINHLLILQTRISSGKGLKNLKNLIPAAMFTVQQNPGDNHGTLLPYLWHHGKK